jgi:hypothetical protein
MIKKLIISLFIIIIFIISLVLYIRLAFEILLKPTSEVISPPEVEVLTHGLYKDNTGMYKIIGEVKNVSSKNLIIEIIAYLYVKKSIAGFGWGFTTIPILVPNQKSPFFIIIKPTTQEKIDRYSLKIKFGTTIQQPYRELKVLMHYSYIDNFGYFHVIGKIRNEGSQDVIDVIVIGTFYDITGTIIAVNSTHVTSEKLTIGQEALFELIIKDKVISYKIINYNLDVWSSTGLYIVSPKW